MRHVPRDIVEQKPNGIGRRILSHCHIALMAAGKATLTCFNRGSGLSSRGDLKSDRIFGGEAHLVRRKML
jgi:hypothetical protein